MIHSSDGGRTRGLSRRDFLYGAAALPLAAAGPRLFAADGPALIVREEDPQNLESPFAALKDFYTPNDLFYIRSHFAAPKLDVKTWRLRVEGAVETPLELTLDDLRKLPAAELPATLECAGNGRSFLEPKAKGVQWGLGAVSTAKWVGAPLAAVLKRAGLRAKAVEVVLEGADRGELKNEPKPAGPQPFARGLPVEKALRAEVLLAYQMNGEALPAAHGHPLRAVVGGWYGVASVKWLSRIVVADRPFHGCFQTTDYTIWETRDGLPSLTPVAGVDVKASIARPAAGQKLPGGKEVGVFGAAWAGEAEVVKVEVSSDGGKSWADARLLGDAVPFCWRLWEHVWKPPARGKYTLMARATDKQGRKQATQRDPDRRNYMISHVMPVEVTVE
jgi:DMSO/TMAO reductase YedYZ molybdopterin-dependent catalytic subunit